VAATGKITFVNLDDAEVEIVVRWEASEMTIRADAESLEADAIRDAARGVVESHLTHLGQGGYVIGEPRPGNEEERGSIP
jgi:hypothetical protein